MIDSYKHKGLRKKLVELIQKKGIKDQRVLTAVGLVKRHLFIENFFAKRAYDDEALPIAAGQTISQPYTVAFQSELLRTVPGSRILEVGTGSGYQAAVLLEMGCKVFSIERQRELCHKTQRLLIDLGYRPDTFFGDGYEGLPTYGPFDGIVVTAGAPEVPKKLLPQLKVGASMVIPIGDGRSQRMITITRKSEAEYVKKEYGNFMFVPMLKGTN